MSDCEERRFIVKKKGITLIEVLVGVAIVVILLATVLGYFGVCRPQSRWRSRWTGKPIELKLPENFSEMVNVSISKGRKNVTYLDTDGNYRTKEVTDSGWLQGEIIWISPRKE